jgi:hypothetical protein
MVKQSFRSCFLTPLSIYHRVSPTSLSRLYVIIMIFVIFLLAMTADAFQQRLVVPATTVAINLRVVVSSASPLPFRIVQENKNECYYKQQVALFAASGGDAESPTYDFIKVEEAEEMIQKERAEHDEEIRKMEDMLEHQREQLREFDHCQDDPELFVRSDDRSGYNRDDNNTRVSVVDGSPFFSSSSSTSSSTTVNSRITAEFRTLEIALQQINDQNKELREQINYQYYSYQSYREEMQQRLSDARDRFDCIQHELSKERSKVNLLETEILEKTERDTRERKQQQEDEEEYQKQQELLVQKQVHQQDHQRDHRLLELERLEERFNDLCQSMDIGNVVDNSNSNSNNIHAIHIPELMDEGREQQQQHQHQYPSDTAYRRNPAHHHFKNFWSE